MNVQKTLIPIAAQNLAGKTTYAQQLVSHYAGIHYSVRQHIRDVYQQLYHQAIPEHDMAFHEFGEFMKKQEGPQVFIEGLLQKFLNSPFQVGVIESLRAPGEALWFLSQKFRERYPTVLSIPIGINAPFSDRLRRFLENQRDDEITPRTALDFQRREKLVNSGKELWQENVEKTLKHVKVFSNPDRKQEELTFAEIIEFIEWSKRAVQS